MLAIKGIVTPLPLKALKLNLSASKGRAGFS